MDNDELQANLTQFTGTERYYRIAPKFLITDGVKYLAENAGCYWLMDATISHLVQLGTADGFVLVRLEVLDRVIFGTTILMLKWATE